MADYVTKNIRNIALLGHGSEGKTTLTEAMLYAAGLIDRQGKVEDGTTVSDYDPDFHQRFPGPHRVEGQQDQRHRRARLL